MSAKTVAWHIVTEENACLVSHKTVAWLWWDANATGIDTGGKHGRYKVSDLDPTDIRAFAVVARSDLEAAEARAQQLAKALEKAKAMPMKYRRMEFNAKLQEEASAANTRAERAEQALRESQENASRLFMACMNILYGIDNHLSITSEIARMREVTTMHSLQAAARAIVDGEQT